MSLNEKGDTMRKAPHQISKKNTSEETLHRIICSGKTTDEIIKDLHKAFPRLKAFEKLDLENERLFFRHRTIKAVNQIKHQLAVIKTIAGIEGDEE